MDVVTIAAMVYASAVLVCAAALIVYRSPRSSETPFISVLISARNEASRLPACLDALARQDYPGDLFEVIVIDDRSTDATSVVAGSFEQRFKNLRVLRVDELSPDMAPKKFALTQGIRAARGEFILCTDADCRPQSKWVGSMASCFAKDVGMVIGYSPIEPRRPVSLMHQFVALDSLALASAACASAAWNKPATATGRSLAYRKKTFDEVGGFQSIGHFISGDDDLLLELVRKTSWKIAYCVATESLVPTDPPVSFGQFLNQKIRQASKGRHYNLVTLMILVAVYLFNLSLLTWVPLQYAQTGNSTLWLAWLVKSGAELVCLTVGGLRFRRIRFLLSFPIVTVLHPLYVVVFGAWGLFGKFDWKDQSHEPRLEAK